MGHSAEVAVGLPDALIRVPGGADLETAAHWAAFYATGLNGYERPVLHGDIVTVEMPPFAPSPARAGFGWIPLDAFAASGNRDLAHLIWGLAARNTWKGPGVRYAWSGLVAAVLMLILANGVPPDPLNAVLAVPGVGLGVASLVAISGDPKPGAARIAAIGAVVLGAITALVPVARAFNVV